MATYAIGDVQGCYQELLALLAEIKFNPGKDQLWFTGDLVNRGPDSLKVLRFVRDLGAAALSVLGNHDLHLLACAEGLAPIHRGDTLDDILGAEDKDELLHWLRHCPLLHHAPELDYTLVHAGLPPQWDIALAQTCAAEVEGVLRSPEYRELLAYMYGNEPNAWDESLTGRDRLRFITNCFTRLRYCDAQGHLYLDAKGEPGTQPAEAMPWFEVPQRHNQNLRIIFGHWSSLGWCREQGIISLDTGCLWGGLLTAYRLDDGAVFSFDCEGRIPIGES